MSHGRHNDKVTLDASCGSRPILSLQSVFERFLHCGATGTGAEAQNLSLVNHWESSILLHVRAEATPTFSAIFEAAVLFEHFLRCGVAMTGAAGAATLWLGCNWLHPGYDVEEFNNMFWTVSRKERSHLLQQWADGRHGVRCAMFEDFWLSAEIVLCNKDWCRLLSVGETKIVEMPKIKPNEGELRNMIFPTYS